MKLSNLIYFVCSALLLSFIFTSNAVAGSNPDPNMQSSTLKNRQAQSEGEIMAFVMALDNHEISVAQTAEQKKLDAQVLSYAKMIRDDHEKNLKEIEELSKSMGIGPVETKAVVQFKEKGQKELVSISKLQEPKFEIAFVNAMVTGHEEAVLKLDHFLNETNDPKLKHFLMETKNSIVNHLDEGKKLQKSL